MLYFCHDFSLLCIETADRPGLLLEVMKIMNDINVNVESAEIETEVMFRLLHSLTCCSTRIVRLTQCMRPIRGWWPRTRFMSVMEGLHWTAPCLRYSNVIVFYSLDPPCSPMNHDWLFPSLSLICASWLQVLVNCLRYYLRTPETEEDSY